MTQAFTPDECCGKHIGKALLKGTLDDAKNWHCPRCDCEWTWRDIEGIRMWEPVLHLEVLRRR